MVGRGLVRALPVRHGPQHIEPRAPTRSSVAGPSCSSEVAPCTSATSSTRACWERRRRLSGELRGRSGTKHGGSAASAPPPCENRRKAYRKRKRKARSRCEMLLRSTRTADNNANTRAAGAGGPRPGARRTRTEGLPDRSRPPSAEVRPRRRRRWPLRPSMEEGQYRERATLRRHR